MGLKNNFLIYGAGNMLYTAVVLLLIPVYLEKLNVGDYGIYSVFYVTGNLLSVLLSLSVSNAVLRYFSEYEDAKQRRSAVSTLFVFFILLGTLTTGLVFILRTTGHDPLEWFRLPDNAAFIPLMLGWTFSRIIYNLILGVLRADNKAVRYVVVTLIDVISLCIINYYIIFKTEFTVELIFWGYLLSSLTTLVVGIFFISRYFFPCFDTGALRYIVTYGLPLSIANALSYLVNYGNRYLVIYFLGDEQVAVFDVSQKITGVLGIIVVNGFMMAFTPYYLNLYKTADANEFSEKINEVLAVFMQAFFLVGAAIILSDYYFLQLLSKETYESSAQYTPFLIVANAFNVLFMLLALTTNINKQTSVEMYISIIMLAVGTICNLLMIPAWGLLGSSISQIMMTVVGFVAINLYNKRRFPLKFQSRSLTFPLFIFISIAVADQWVTASALSLPWKLSLSIVLLLIVCLQVLYSLPQARRSFQILMRKR